MLTSNSRVLQTDGVILSSVVASNRFALRAGGHTLGQETRAERQRSGWKVSADTPDEAKTTLRGTYHHGGLSDVLMNLASAQIARGGMEKLSLRALAREAGVSATAPYRHFPSRESLLAAIAQRGFQTLTASIDLSLQSGGTFEERFIAMGMAYIRHAVDDPVSYHLMFGEMVGSGKYPDLAAAADESFGRLLQILQDNAPLQRLDVTALELSAVVWAGVHGIASLLITDLHRPLQGGPPAQAGKALVTLAEHPERALRLLFLKWFG